MILPSKNDPRLIAAVKDFAQKSILEKIHAVLDDINDRQVIHDGDSISISYTLEVDAGALWTIANVIGAKLPKIKNPKDN